ncbi:hypothetical protein CEXT_430401 [Caerostris extrusa]|uniref:Uncharacterized protein n=1 Tax=Caerostris extrusa TaxID=172846 RepID=A0AAV4XPR8_CAEEX|nr:hypothetical protein CEXT_430401 [Caerostris extrusa]
MEEEKAQRSHSKRGCSNGSKELWQSEQEASRVSCNVILTESLEFQKRIFKNGPVAPSPRLSTIQARIYSYFSDYSFDSQASQMRFHNYTVFPNGRRKLREAIRNEAVLMEPRGFGKANRRLPVSSATSH